MKYVGVMHSPEQTKLYWFAVPAGVSPYVTVGSEVLCDTSIGRNTGTVHKILDGVTEAEMLRFAQFDKRRLPVKHILAVARDVRLEEIHVPFYMRDTKPSADKIAKRLNEFYESGRFQTPVIFSQNMNLQDGYTAYLVANMMGLKTLHGFCVAL